MCRKSAVQLIQVNLIYVATPPVYSTRECKGAWYVQSVRARG